MRSITHVVIVCVLWSPPARAQEPRTGAIDGFITTQGGTVRLLGAAVTVTDASNRQATEVVSDEDGHFRVPDLAPGRYVIAASLDGFETRSAVVDVSSDRKTDLWLDLPIAKISQSVDVVAANPIVSNEGTIASTDTIGGKELEQFAPSGGLEASLRLLATIIDVPGGISIKGGRPSQAGFQLGPSTLIDPATGATQVSLPDDAIDSVAVLPNPYAVEYGRFSSGLVVIQTRRAADEWKLRLNDVDPTLRTRRGSAVDVLGVGWWAPRIEVGGPLIKDRLFLEQTAQYRYSARDVPSLPQNLLRIGKSFSSFTRLDANLSPRHSLTASGGVFPIVSDDANLGTFTPPDATVNLHSQANQSAVTERWSWSDSFYDETTVQMHTYGTHVLPQGSAAMQLLPQTTLGNFFNQQRRDTNLYQVIESLSGAHKSPVGLHLFKIGLDVLHSQYSGSSLSRPVLIERTDGSIARRLDFRGVPTMQSIGSTDVAIFAQDRLQANTRWYVEFGGRLDRDGVVDRFNFTPRAGAALLLNDSGSAILRGGFGLFYERTPSVAGTFDEFESVVDTRFGSDGVMAVGAPVLFVHTTAPGLETPRSSTWDVSYDHRLSKMWTLHLGAIDRQGRHELIVTPTRTDATGQLLLSSTGRSSYRGAEVGLHFTRGSTADLNVSYARSGARADLNALASYFDPVLSPVVGANAYAPAGTDAPNRLLARGRLMPTTRWLVLGIFDWRSGLPYSVVNEALDFVGPRNSRRFPTYLRLETGLEHRFKILKFQPWIGVRVWNALDSFLPTEVQNNFSSPAFGSFYNSEYRQVRVQVRFER